MLWLKSHSRRLLRACLLGSERKLPLPACQVQLGLPYVVCCPRGVQFPGTVYICNQCPLSLDPTVFLVHTVLCTQCLQPLEKILFLPTPVQQTARNLSELCWRSRPVPQIMICLSCIYSVLSTPLLPSKSRSS